MGKILINGKHILTTAEFETKVEMKGATMSSNYRKGDKDKAAALAIDGDQTTYFHTKCGADEWWSAQFNERFMVTEVKIQNRLAGAESSNRRLQKAEITVEGQFCANLPENTPGVGEWYTVKCERPVGGTNIMVRNTLKKCLHFTSIEVKGFRMDNDGNRGVNLVAISASDHTVLLAKSYDLAGNNKADEALVRDVRGLRRGTIVLAAVRGDAKANKSKEVMDTFAELGSKEILSLGEKEGWGFIGVRGQTNAIEKRGGYNEFGVVLGYAKRTRRTRTREESQAGSSIEVFSAGYAAGKENSYAEIRINGDDVVSRKNSKRGINVVALNGADHKIILNGVYNTSNRKKNESDRLVKDLSSLPEGTVIIAAVRDDGARNLKHSAKKVFMAMGSQDIKKLGYKQSWGFIGVKGLKRYVEQSGVTTEFGTVLSYTKVVKKERKVEKVEGGSKIQALSSGSEARILINNIDVLKDPKPGFNVIVLAGANHEIIFTKHYDTAGNTAAAQQMVEDEATAPIGSVIIAVMMGDGAKLL